MSVKIRLRRMGQKGQPSYRVVVTDSRNPRDGRFIETIGFYDPISSPPVIRFDEGKALDWLRKGAIPSDTTRSLLTKNGIWSAFTQGGAVPPERRQALAARKERAGVRRSGRAVTRRAEGSPVGRRGRAKPAKIETRTGETKVKMKQEGMPPVSETDA
ncbi:MAG: 30S ribosomal protein S16 [Gemmatimonadetes bacterium]|nr:30S ribosomal protein S16 [Gemmatimonadota bacterium]